jgi:iron complex outermembrane receptor protein
LEIKFRKRAEFSNRFKLEYPHFEVSFNGFYNHINNYIFISPNGTKKKALMANDVYDCSDGSIIYGETGVHFIHPLGIT